MDNSVDTNVLVDSTPTCSSNQVMNLGAVVPTDPTTCTTVSMLSSTTPTSGNLAKPVGGAVSDNKIYLLTDKPYLLHELRFGYACIETTTESVTDETTNETTTVSSTNTIFVNYDSSPRINQYGLYDFRSIGTTTCSGIANLQIYGYDNLFIETTNICISSCNYIYVGRCTYDLFPDAELISCVSYTNCINVYSDHITVGAPVLDRVYYEKCLEDNWELDLSSEKFGTKVIELQAMDSISIGCSPVLLAKPCADLVIQDNAFNYYSNHGDYHYVSELRLYGGCISITANSSLCISTDLYDSTTKQGTYEATKGISTLLDENGIPDLVNRIFKYSGTVTSFSAKPKYTDQMKDNVLYEFEVWHTIPDASGITYTSPTNVEWLYGDPAESGIELTDGITLYYAFRAFKSGTDVRVQGNLYATTTPQATQE
jgi:hypothetical protein